MLHIKTSIVLKKTFKERDEICESVTSGSGEEDSDNEYECIVGEREGGDDEDDDESNVGSSESDSTNESEGKLKM